MQSGCFKLVNPVGNRRRGRVHPTMQLIIGEMGGGEGRCVILKADVTSGSNVIQYLILLELEFFGQVKCMCEV